MPSRKLPTCPFCGKAFSYRKFSRHRERCHMQQPADKPLHFSDLAYSPFTIKSPYRKD